MKPLFAAFIASAGLVATAASESAGQYDSVSRFAGSDAYVLCHGAGSAPRARMKVQAGFRR